VSGEHSRREVISASWRVANYEPHGFTAIEARNRLLVKRCGFRRGAAEIWFGRW
jgi:hypothetical protein